MPFWVPLAMAAGGAILGKQKADRQRAIEDETRKMRAAEQQYSWASGRDPRTEIQHAGSAMGEIAGGALGGLGTGLSMEKSGLFKGAEGDLVEGAGTTAGLGAPDYASQMTAQQYPSLGMGGGSMYESELKKLQAPTLMSSVQRKPPGLGGGGGGFSFTN